MIEIILCTGFIGIIYFLERIATRLLNIDRAMIDLAFPSSKKEKLPRSYIRTPEQREAASKRKKAEWEEKRKTIKTEGENT